MSEDVNRTYIRIGLIPIAVTTAAIIMFTILNYAGMADKTVGLDPAALNG